MEAPLPASALIHSATLVASGLYLFLTFKTLVTDYKLITFLNFYFSFTFFFGSFVALVQTDFKKILAYSTISNCAAIFLTILHLNTYSTYLYFATHGWFKSLSFLILGFLTVSFAHKQDLRSLIQKNYSTFITISFSIITIISLANWLVIQSSMVKHNLFNLNFFSFFSLLFLIFGGVCSTLYSLKIISYVFVNFLNTKKNNKIGVNLHLFYLNISFLLFIFLTLFFFYTNTYNYNYNYIMTFLFFLVICTFIFFQNFISILIQKSTILNTSDITGVLTVNCFHIYQKKKKNIGSFGSLIKISTREVLFKYKKLRKKKSKAIVILLKYKFTKPDGSFIKFYKNTCVLLKRRIVPTATFVIGCCPYNLRRKKFLTSFKVII